MLLKHPDDKLRPELEVLLKAYELIETEINESLKNKYSVGAIFSSALLALFLLIFNPSNPSYLNTSSNISGYLTSGLNIYLNTLLFLIPYLILLLATCMVSHRRTLLYEISYSKKLECRMNKFCKENCDINDDLVTLETEFLPKYFKEITPLEITLIIFCSFIYILTMFQILSGKVSIKDASINNEIYLFTFGTIGAIVDALLVSIFLISIKVISETIINSSKTESHKIYQKVVWLFFVFLVLVYNYFFVNKESQYYVTPIGTPVQGLLNLDYFTYFVVTGAYTILLILYLVIGYTKEYEKTMACDEAHKETETFDGVHKITKFLLALKAFVATNKFFFSFFPWMIFIAFIASQVFVFSFFALVILITSAFALVSILFSFS